MKSLFLAFVFITGIQGFIDAQETTTLKKLIGLRMPEGDGHNAASVAWHPIQQKYYAGFAGNARYPMAVFDEKGKRLSENNLQVGFDLRGLWYNSITNTLQGNGYNDFGWTNFSLNKMGIPIGNKVFAKKINQPTEQAVGSFDNKKELLYFLSDNKIVSCDLKGGQKNETKLILAAGETDEEAGDDLPEKYNNTTVIFTGIENAEWGLLDTESKEVVLFDSATGKATQKWAIDPDDDFDFSTSFGFAYANGIVFIFNKEERLWVGYK